MINQLTIKPFFQMETLNFYNYFHNGDVFFSRIILKPFFEQYKINFFHKEKFGLFRDLPNIKENCGIPENYDWEKNKIFNTGDLVNTPINCWLAQTIEGRGEPFQNFPYGGCAFENYVELSKEISNLFGLKTYQIEEYLPTVIYENLPNYKNIFSIVENHKKNYKKIILVSNGEVRSSQSLNFDFGPIIDVIANNNRDVLFLVTDNINSQLPNVIHTSQITNTSPDLLEISLISKLSDVIVGRASGPYCFAQTKENLLDVNKTFVCFCYNPNIARFYQSLKSKMIWSSNYDQHSIINNIQNSI